MPWLGITAIALAGWYLFFHRKEGRWVHSDLTPANIPNSSDPVGTWTYQAGNGQLWLVSVITLGNETSWIGSRPGTGGQATAKSPSELALRMDEF